MNRRKLALMGCVALLPPLLYVGYHKSRRTPHYPYVLVGGGTASFFAAQTIRARDPNAKVLIIGEERETPYNRSKLSKVLTSEEWERVPYETDGYYPTLTELANMKNGGISLMRSTRVARIDETKHVVVLGNGNTIGYDKCLLATGSQARSTGPRIPGVMSDFRTVEDSKALHALIDTNPTQRIAIVGGGLLACELAHSLRSRPLPAADEERPSVTQILDEPYVLKPLVPMEVAFDVQRELTDAGVELLPNTHVRYIPLKDGKLELQLESRGQEAGKNDDEEKSLSFDCIIIDSAVVPRTEVAVASGFKIDKDNGGVRADSRMRVSDSVWAAGDVCSFYDPMLGRRRLAAGWEQAQTTGRLAGEDMTGGYKDYAHQAAFQTILGISTFLTGLGEVDTEKHQAITLKAQQKTPSDETRAVTVYVDRTSNKVVGALLYNVFGSGLDVARKLIAEEPLVKNPEEAAKLFDLFDR